MHEHPHSHSRSNSTAPDTDTIEILDAISPTRAQHSNELPDALSRMEHETRTWAVVLHLSTLLSFASFGIGIIVPIVIWQWKKTALPKIDEHGRIVMNALISYCVYFFIAFILCLLLIGFVLLWVMGLAAVVFPIIAALNAWQGKTWRYPLCMTFFKTP